MKIYNRTQWFKRIWILLDSALLKRLDLPGCGATVGEGQIANSFIVHHAQDRQRTTDRMASFYTYQTAYMSGFKCFYDFWNQKRRK